MIIYMRCMYGTFGREITKYTVIYGVFIRSWPTLLICIQPNCSAHTVTHIALARSLAEAILLYATNSLRTYCDSHRSRTLSCTDYSIVCNQIAPHILWFPSLSHALLHRLLYRMQPTRSAIIILRHPADSDFLYSFVLQKTCNESRSCFFL